MISIFFPKCFPSTLAARCTTSTLLSILLLIPLLSGCELLKEEPPATLTLSLTGDYAEDFLDGGWRTATITATAVDAEGKSIPLSDDNLYWGLDCYAADSLTAWNQNHRDNFSGFSWGKTPLPQQLKAYPAIIPGDDSGPTVHLTDIVGSRRVTVSAYLKVYTPDGEEEQEIVSSVTFTFGDGPLSLFSGPPYKVLDWAAAVQACSDASQASGQAVGLPSEAQLQLVAQNNGKGFGAAIAAGWPGDLESFGIYNYWTGDTENDGKDARVVNLGDGFSLGYLKTATGPYAICIRR